MKKFSKISMILAGALIVAGVISYADAFSVNDSPVAFGIQLTSDPGVRKTYVAETTAFEKIHIKEWNNHITIQVTNEDKVKISYYETDHWTYEIREDKDTLNVIANDDRRWYEHITVFSSLVSLPRDIVVEIPRELMPAVEVENSNGAIEVSDLEIGAGSTFTTSNGRIEFNDVNAAGSLRLKSSNAQIILNEVSGTEIEAVTCNGKIILNKVSGTEIEAVTCNGKIELTDVAAGRLDMDTSNAKIELMGSIVADDIRLKTSNGKIVGTIEGRESEYSITSDTSNASSSLPKDRAGGSKNLWVKTSNAKIELSFTER